MKSVVLDTLNPEPFESFIPAATKKRLLEEERAVERKESSLNDVWWSFGNGKHHFSDGFIARMLIHVIYSDKFQQLMKDFKSKRESQKEVTYEQFKDALEIVKQYKRQVEIHLKSVMDDTEGLSKFSSVTPDTKIAESGASSMLKNRILQNYDRLLKTGKPEGKGCDSWVEFMELPISNLTGLSVKEFSECRGVGKVAVNELKELCHYAGVKLNP